MIAIWKSEPNFNYELFANRPLFGPLKKNLILGDEALSYITVYQSGPF